MTFQDCIEYSDYIKKELVVRGEFIEGLSKYNNTLKDGAETIAEGFTKFRYGEKNTWRDTRIN